MNRSEFLRGLAGTATLIALPLREKVAMDTTRSAWWRGLATSALARFVAADNGAGQVFGYGMAAGASGVLNGWGHATTTRLLSELLDTQITPGRYGLRRPYDAFSDGTTNPATTAYSVSVAGPAGNTLLAAYVGGATVVARSDVQACINTLMKFPRIPVARGAAVAYSDNPNDNPTGKGPGQVHNVSAGVGAFLADCNAAGFGATGMQRLIADIGLCETVSFKESWLGWPYKDADATIQDADHGSYTVEAFYGRTGGCIGPYWSAREACYRMMTTSYANQTKGQIVHTRLASLPGGPGSWSTVYPGYSLWSEYGYTKWRAEQDAYAAAVTGESAAQFAYYAALNVAATL
jgi:hypothetical protein